MRRSEAYYKIGCQVHHQRNKELESRVMKIAKNFEEELEETSGVESSLTENEMGDHIKFVINEIHKNDK